MQREEYLCYASLVIAHALLENLGTLDEDKVLELSNRLTDKVFEKAQQETPKTVIQRRSRNKITDIDEIIYPFTSPEFMEQWNRLIKMPKWRKKEPCALQASLDKLAKYEEGFAIELVTNAIAGEYQGVVFPSTEEAYRKWLAGRGTRPGQTPQYAQQRGASKLEQNAMAAAEAAKILLGNQNDIFDGE